MLNLPAHLTHLLQVADIAVFGPFKKHLRSVRALAKHHRNGTIAPQHIAALTRPAWENAITRQNVIQGFAKAGIVPFDRTKITDKIYRQGVRMRQYADDSSHFAVPPVPPLPPIVLDSPSVPSSVPSSSPPVLETISSILAPPAPIPLQPPTQRHFSGVNTTYAVMLSQQSIINQLIERKEQKDKIEEEKKERKRKREEKKLQPTVKKAPAPRKKKPRGITFTDRLRNKENTPPTSQNINYDPYE